MNKVLGFVSVACCMVYVNNFCSRIEQEHQLNFCHSNLELDFELVVELCFVVRFILMIYCSLIEQAQQLFQRDAQTITPEALESVKAALASSEIEHKAETKKKAIPRKAAGQTWEDPTLADWPESKNWMHLTSLF